MPEFIRASDIGSKIDFIQSQVAQGKSFTVLSHSQPVFQITPVEKEKHVELLKGEAEKISLRD